MGGARWAPWRKRISPTGSKWRAVEKILINGIGGASGSERRIPRAVVGRRAMKSMSGAADDSTTKFPISGKVPLEWLMHRLASPSPGHAQSVGVFVTPVPCVATVQLGGVSRPSNVRASARSMSQWVCSLLGFFMVPSICGVPSLIVSSAPRSNLLLVWVVDRWVWMLLLVRNGHVSGEMVVCVSRLRASCIELSSRTPLQCPPLVAVVPKGVR
ncbi:hypothetical protein V6N13_116801 [Hibiscus sabdariffa]